MTSAAARSGLGPDAFLAWDREQPARHLYVRGEVFAMARGSPRHSYLGTRAILQLGRSVRDGRCDVHGSDLRLEIDSTHFAYADAVVVCRPLTLRPGTTDVVTNPALVVEVLSRSTEAYDRGDKQASYLALPSVEHFLLVSQREPRVELYTREADGSFRYTVHGAGARIDLGRHGAIDVDELYAGAWELAGDDPLVEPRP